MPIALIAALAGSLAIHLAGVFGVEVELFGEAPEAEPLQAEIRLPPPAALPFEPAPLINPAPNKSDKPAKLAKVKKARGKVKTRAASLVAPTPPLPTAEIIAENSPEIDPEIDPKLPSTAAIIALPAAKAILPAQGVIRFAIIKESLGFQVGRAEQRWEFFEDGRYQLTGITETSGLAAVFKPVRLSVESRGRLVAGGLQPESLRTLKNGQATNENADFSWSTAEVTLSRDGSVRSIVPGTQDILSLNYQLAYLARLDDGASIGVVTGKKYERYTLDSLGEEEIDTPAGRFRTLHLRAMTDSVTEIWIALDHGRLPVKIRFTDKKGESFEQVATEIGMP
ncbi:MAG: hypothetical protein CVU16_08790 [Betaproteobacteria bacterium HGW-Betaproteobacteria-10]|nr:MAG: hypothetical protein CVU16_08790 [Betaproteobacteria bacterium HGW-Betaproteobacteria-10]